MYLYIYFHPSPLSYLSLHLFSTSLSIHSHPSLHPSLSIHSHPSLHASLSTLNPSLREIHIDYAITEMVQWMLQQWFCRFTVRDFVYNEDDLKAGKEEIVKLATDKKKQFVCIIA